MACGHVAVGHVAGRIITLNVAEHEVLLVAQVVDCAVLGGHLLHRQIVGEACRNARAGVARIGALNASAHQVGLVGAGYTVDHAVVGTAHEVTAAAYFTVDVGVSQLAHTTCRAKALLELGHGSAVVGQAVLELVAALQLEVTLSSGSRTLLLHLLNGELAFGTGLELRLVEVAEVCLALASSDFLGALQLIEGNVPLGGRQHLVVDELLELTRTLGSGVTVEVHLAVDVEVALGGELRVGAQHPLHVEVALILENGAVDLVHVAVVVALLFAGGVLHIEQAHLLTGHIVNLPSAGLLVSVVLLSTSFGLPPLSEGTDTANDGGGCLKPRSDECTPANGHDRLLTLTRDCGRKRSLVRRCPDLLGPARARRGMPDTRRHS